MEIMQIGLTPIEKRMTSCTPNINGLMYPVVK